MAATSTAEETTQAASAKQLEHLDGCPAPKDRIEQYEQLRPRDRQFMTVIRCQECGSQRSTVTGRFAKSEERNG